MKELAPQALVSVIVTVYNCEPSSAMLSKVSSSNVQQFEIIVVDIAAPTRVRDYLNSTPQAIPHKAFRYSVNQ